MMQCSYLNIIDRVSATVITLITSPLWLLLVVILRCTGEGKIFYLQSRVGKGGKLFSIVKFATMLEQSPHLGTGMITIPEDPRVLPVGKFLRASKLNELPQLLNVMKGDMSLVGPRPLVPENFNYYSDYGKAKILTVLPGLTGLGSIIFRNEERLFRNVEDEHLVYRDSIAPIKENLEVYFVENYGFKLYFSILLLTLIVVIKGDYKNFEFLLPRGLPIKDTI